MAQNKDKKPVAVKPSESKFVKNMWHKSGSPLPLKRWLRERSDDVTMEHARNWRHNKQANTSKPQQGIGRTNRLGKSGSASGSKPKNK